MGDYLRDNDVSFENKMDCKNINIRPKNSVSLFLVFISLFLSCRETNPPILPEILESGYFRSIYFIDADTGWVVGKFGSIMRSTDGGLTWEPQTSGISQYLRSLTFIDNKVGWAVGW